MILFRVLKKLFQKYMNEGYGWGSVEGVVRRREKKCSPSYNYISLYKYINFFINFIDKIIKIGYFRQLLLAVKQI